MFVIDCRNVHRALPRGLNYLDTQGIRTESRNGPVVVSPMPVTTVYSHPRERVIFYPARDANPFFHFMEGLWMLAGKNDIEFLAQYNSRMKDFSDDGVTLHGAYGYRWKEHFWPNTSVDPLDQLKIIIDRLKNDPWDRRSILTMWDPIEDLGMEGKDFPCNTHIYFSRYATMRLDMTVCCRSNDIVWGAYGANAVHMSMMQEYMASMIGCPVGKYWQISNNYHAYTAVMEPLIERMKTDKNNSGGSLCPYMTQNIEPLPMVYYPETWDEDLDKFFDGETNPHKYVDPFFSNVVLPIANAHKAYKAKCYDDAIQIIQDCKAPDWRLACREWLERRKAAHEKASDNGVNYEQGK